MNQLTSTTIVHEGETIKIIYHSTVVVEISKKNIILNTGGWNTSTTKRRMNQASKHFSLGFNVYQKNFKWFCFYQQKTFSFNGNKLILKKEEV